MFTRRKFFAKFAGFCAAVGLPVATGAVLIPEDELHYTIENFPNGRRIYLNGLDVTDAAFECKFRGGIGWVKMFTYDVVDGKATFRKFGDGRDCPRITRYGRIEIR